MFPRADVYTRSVCLGIETGKEVVCAASMVTPPLVQVTNVSPQTTDQQMKELFSYLGDIEEIRVYPSRYF